MSSTIEIIATLIALALGIGSLFSAIGQLISERRQRGAIRQQLTLGRSRGAEVEGISVESPEQRINRLIASLSEAANAAEEIGEEIKSRQEVAKKLQEDIQRYEQLREVNGCAHKLL